MRSQELLSVSASTMGDEKSYRQSLIGIEIKLKPFS
jgi:hypothetical protein